MRKSYTREKYISKLFSNIKENDLAYLKLSIVIGALDIMDQTSKPTLLFDGLVCFSSSLGLYSSIPNWLLLSFLDKNFEYLHDTL